MPIGGEKPTTGGAALSFTRHRARTCLAAGRPNVNEVPPPMCGSGSFCLDETNTRVFFENPGKALIHLTALQYTPVNTDILPTFVMLHLAFPLVLWLLIRNAAVALGASFLLYLMVQIYG